MYFCYIDESGDSSTLVEQDNNSNPFFILVALIIHQEYLIPITLDFIKFKKIYYPNLSPKNISDIDLNSKLEKPFLEGILAEIKGSDIRSHFRTGSTNAKKTDIGFLNQCLNLLKKYDVKLLGSTLVKQFNRKNSDASFYGQSILYFGAEFEKFLCQKQQTGLIIADSRKSNQNYRTSHTFFTQRHQCSGNAFPHILESVTYGHSHNFAMLQLTDIVCSALLYPMYSISYGSYISQQNPENVHISSNYLEIYTRFANRLKHLQFKYKNEDGLWRGGIKSIDNTPLHRSNSTLFKFQLNTETPINLNNKN